MSKKQADSNKSANNSGAKLQIKKGKKDKDKSIQKQLKIVAEEKSSPKQKDKQQKQDKKETKEEKKAKKKKDKKKNKDKKSQGQQEQEVSPKKKDKKKNKDKKFQGQQEQEGAIKKSQSKQNQNDQKESKDKKNKKDKKQKKDKKKKDKNKSQEKQQSPPEGKKQNLKSKKSISLLSKKGDKELDTIKSIHKSQNTAKLTIQQLIQQYKSAAEDTLFNKHGHDPQKEKEIQKHLQSLQKQKQNRRKKMEQLDRHKQQIAFSKEKQKETKKQLRYQKLRQKKIQKIEQKLSNLQISAQQRKRQYQKFKEYVCERKKIQPRFKRYEEQFQQGLEQEQQSYRQRMQQILKKYQPMNKNELDHFQQNYTLQKEQTHNYRVNKLKLEQDLIEEENDRFRSKLWKGQCHRNVQEEIELLQEKKKKPKQKLQAMKEYGKIVAQSRVKEDKQQTPLQIEDKEEEIKINQNVQYHDKYIKGVNYGLVPIQITTPLTLEQKSKLGRAYLQHAKEINSVQKSKTVDHGDSKKFDDSRELKNRSQTFKIKRVSNPYYGSPVNRKSLDFNNYESIEYSIQKIGSISKDKELHDQIIRHGQYGSILQIQQKKRKIGHLMVKQINDKLDLLNKL